MKARVSHGVVKTKTDDGICMMIWEMTPQMLNLKKGQEFYVLESNPKTGESRKKYVKIQKFYPYHALCVVNGSFHECYTYSELYLMGIGNDGRV